MSRTLHFGTHKEDLRLASRIDRHIVRRRTNLGYDRLIEMANSERDFRAHQVAEDVTRETMGRRYVVTLPPYAHTAPGFGRRGGGSR